MDLPDDLGAGAVAAASASDPAEDGAESNSEPLLLSPVEAAALLLALPPPTELEDPCFEFDSPAFLVQLGFDSRLGSRLSAIGSANQLLISG